MKNMALTVLLILGSFSVFAADPCTSKGGEILTGTMGRGIVRICAFSESGIGSAIGYNDIDLKKHGVVTKAVKAFLAKKTADSLALGAKAICKKQSATTVQISLGDGGPVNFCSFADGSLIDTITLSFGPDVAKELAAALK